VHKGYWWGDEGHKPIGRPGHRCEDIKIDLQRVGWGGTNWTDLAQIRYRSRELVNEVMNLRVP